MGNIDYKKVRKVGFEVIKKGDEGLLKEMEEFKEERRYKNEYNKRDLGWFFLWIYREG